MANVLIIDDDHALCRMLSSSVARMGHRANYKHSLDEGLHEAMDLDYDVVLLDVHMPDGNGLDLLPRIKETPSTPEVIIMTGRGDSDGAEIAIKNGAWDYVQKPISPKSIILPLKRILQYREDLKKAQKHAIALKPKGIIGSSPRITACLDALAHAANSNANVLITGETGTGKELFARAIQANSARRKQNFVVVDCASLPESLVESSLFGYEKGAFTGADHSRIGLIKQADGGTLFLDEVGELTLSLQKAFLRVLQEHRFRPVGAKTETESNFRLISATNQNLDDIVKIGAFRKDLLYRLRSISIELPPLRDRAEDIKELVVHHASKICEAYQKETKGISPDFFEAMQAYFWPGNVRELIHTLEGAISEAHEEPILYAKHLPENIRIHVIRNSVSKKKSQNADYSSSQKGATAQCPSLPSYKIFREITLAAAEKKYFQDLITLSKGSIKDACTISGLGRTRLYTLLKKHNIARDGWSATRDGVVG